VTKRRCKCGKSFPESLPSQRPPRRWCSDRCYQKHYHRKLRRKSPPMRRVLHCFCCGREIHTLRTKHAQSIYCRWCARDIGKLRTSWWEREQYAKPKWRARSLRTSRKYYRLHKKEINHKAVERIMQRYHSDPVFREKISRINKKYRLRHKAKGEA
jgi:hypothetical protein